MAETPHPQTTWLVRISPVFKDLENDLLRTLGASIVKRLGRDFLMIRLEEPGRLHSTGAAKYLRWILPVHHAWPCHPRETEGFVEKAAQAMFRKFSGEGPQTLIAGPLDPAEPGRYHKSLASNLRGRSLQLFPPSAAALRDAEEQDPAKRTLFLLVGREGLFCGLNSPRDSKGFHAGGTRFIRQNRPETISRAGAKIAEALHHLELHRPRPHAGAHWLELGASPGGMTSELLDQGYRVTAVDKAPLDARLNGHAGLKFVRADASDFQPARGEIVDAILSDMNGAPREAMAKVVALTGHLAPGGIVVFTLKLAGAENFDDMERITAEALAAAKGLSLIALVHLTYNRNEFTAIFEKAERPET